MAAVIAESDMVHPLAKIDRIYDNGITIYEGARVFLVSGLTDGSSDQSKTALNRAIEVNGLPKIGDPYPGKPGLAGCVCTGHRPISLNESDDAVLVVAIYSTPLPIGGTTQAVIVSVEKDTVLLPETAQLHPADGSLIVVQLPNTAPKDQQFRPADIPYNPPMKRMTITAVVRVANVDALEDAVGTVNDTTWQGKPAGFWLYNHFREITTNQFPIVIALSLEFLTRIRRPWLQYDIARSDMLGTRLSVDPKVLVKVRAMKYFYGQSQLPGITVAGMYPMISFRRLLGIA